MPDVYGHADAWYMPPAPSGVDVDDWAQRERTRWAAELLVEGTNQRAERVRAASEILETLARRDPRAAAALRVRTDGPGPGPRSICLTPDQRAVLRSALVALGQKAPSGGHREFITVELTRRDAEDLEAICAYLRAEPGGVDFSRAEAIRIAVRELAGRCRASARRTGADED